MYQRLFWGLIGAFILLFTHPFQQVKAGHVVGGGNITWECIGPDRYEVKISAYRDCLGAGSINIDLSVGCRGSASIGNIVKRQIGSTKVSDITPVCESACTSCDNSQCSNSYGYEKFTETYIVDLSNANCCKVRFSYSNCCRSNGLTYCDGKPFYVSSWFDHCQVPCDNSPRFRSPAQVLACKNQGYKRNLRAYDTDTDSTGKSLDSLAYELTCPKTSSSNTCSGSGGIGSPNYTCKKPLHFKLFPNANFPYPNGFNLDPQSGQLKFTPTKQQVAPLAFEVKQYRDTNSDGQKELFGVVTREAQISVENCKPNNIPEITGLPCSGSSKKATACAGIRDTFSFCTNDPDNGDSVSLTFNRGTLPDSAKWKIKDTQAQYPKANIIWKPIQNDIRSQPYRFTLKADDDVCPINGRVVEPFKIKVNPRPEVNLRFDSIACGRYKFIAEPLNNVSPKYQWQGAGGLHASKDSFVHQFTKPGRYPFRLVVNAGGCEQIYRDTVEVKPFTRYNLKPDTNICKGTDLRIGGRAKDSTGSVTYLWHDGVTGVARRTFKDLRKDTFMTLKVSDKQCNYNDSVNVNVLAGPKIELNKDSARLCATDTISLSVASTYPDYQWNTGDTNSRIYVDTQGFYQVTVTDTSGCSSKDSIQLVAVRNDTIKQRDTACTRFTWAVTGQTYQQSGTYYGSRQNSNFCDSSATIALDLTINKKEDTTIAREACGQYTVPSQDETYQQSGTYKDTLSTISGCDSVITINLTINKPDFKADTVKTCETYTWPVNGQAYQQSGTYTDTFTNQAGCDSIRQLALTIYPTKQNTLKPVACKSYTVPSQDETYTSSGTYYDTLSSAKNCDSILTIQLTVPNPETAIERNGQTLSVSSPNPDSFQWLNCEGGLAPIKGATNSSFQPDSNGRYAVVVSEEGCTDTSSCYAIETIGFRNNDFGKSLKVYPNPANDQVTVKFNQSHQVIRAELISSSGQTLSSKTYRGTKQFEVPLPETQGYYILNLTSSKGRSAQIKLLKN